MQEIDHSGGKNILNTPVNPNITQLVDRRYGTAAMMATTQQMAITKVALVRSENGRMDRFIGLQITRYLSMEKDKMVSTLAYEALVCHQTDIYLFTFQK